MDEELLTSLFKQMKFVITPNKLKRFYKELEPTLNKIRLWIYNGYNLEEINELKKEKI